jgi:cob(I)alamin adenosyltransferase
LVRLNKIYTRTGDDGTTGLVDAVDEANSAIGLAVCAMADSPHAATLTRIQNDLFDLGADLATPGEDFTPGEMTLRVVDAQVEWLETAIDAVNANLQPLKSFILPGGSEAAARVHVARASTRAAERRAVALAAAEPVNPAALAYINRLSDYLFVLARALNENGADDVLWVPGQNR